MYSRREALSFAKQYRTCPPVSIRADRRYADRVDRHLEICPYCADLDVDQARDWERLAGQLGGSVVLQENTMDDDPAGGIYTLKSELAGWRGDFYYTPCQVLVMERIDLPIGAVLAAQLYHDITLAGPGDLILSEGQTVLGELFIEGWNQYTLPVDFLGPRLDRLPPEILNAVRRLTENPADPPSWAPRPRPMTDHDPRLTFRRLEVRVGYTFASQGAGKLLASVESPVPRLMYSRTQEVEAELRKIRSGLRFPGGCQDIEELLLRAEFAPGDLPLAAADPDRPTMWARLVYIQTGMITGLEPVRAEVFSRRAAGSAIVISGRVEMPAGAACQLTAGLEEKDGRLRRPFETVFEDGEFLLRFEKPTASTGRLQLTLFCEVDDRP